MAAGLPGSDEPDGDVRNVARARAVDQSHPVIRFAFDRADLRRGAVPPGTAVSTRKHIEIVFEGLDSSCYPSLCLGAEGIVSSMSRSPN